MSNFMHLLRDLKTGEIVRGATHAECEASDDAAQFDGGVGAIEVDGQICYVAKVPIANRALADYEE